MHLFLKPEQEKRMPAHPEIGDTWGLNSLIKGPVKLLTWGRGYATVLSPSGPLWIPARCVKLYHELAPQTQESTTRLNYLLPIQYHLQACLL